MRLRAVLDALSQAVILVQADGTIVDANRSALRLLNVESPSLLDRPIAQVGWWRDNTPAGVAARARLASAIASATAGARVTIDLSDPPATMTLSPVLFDPSGEPLVAVEIRSSSTADAALRESEARSRAILDNAVDGIVTIDATGIVKSFNRAAERLFGYRADEVIGRNVSMLMPQPYARDHDGYLRNYLDTGAARIIGIGREVVAMRKDGSIFPIDLSVSEVIVGQQRLFTGIVHDLTERKTLERQILEISDAEKRRIGQDLHDGLGQSLTGIGFKTKALETRLAARSVPEAESARQLAELVTQAILQSRAIARGLQPVSVERAGLMAALSELASSLTDLFKIDCVLDCPHRVLIADPATALHLYRIAQEAANNAIKHARATRIVISLSRGGDGKVRLSISDDGRGFAHPDSSVAGPASGAVTSAASATAGAASGAAPGGASGGGASGGGAPGGGSGLHIMRYRAAMIGGRLAVESRPGAGTTVSCILDERVPSAHPTLDRAIRATPQRPANDGATPKAGSTNVQQT